MMAKDQLGRIVNCPEWPQRIISLVPSQTELLYEFGLREEIHGITKFCIHPEDWFGKKTKVGGTKHLRYEIIDEIAPDLIIANKEENRKEDIEILARRYNVWVSDVSDLFTAFEMIRGIGMITGRMQEAIQIVQEINEGFLMLERSDLRKEIARLEISTAYMIWRNPYMAAGNDMFHPCHVECLRIEKSFCRQTDGIPRRVLMNSAQRNARSSCYLQNHFPSAKIISHLLRTNCPIRVSCLSMERCLAGTEVG